MATTSARWAPSATTSATESRGRAARLELSGPTPTKTRSTETPPDPGGPEGVVSCWLERAGDRTRTGDVQLGNREKPRE